jgi:hypothetical protein
MLLLLLLLLLVVVVLVLLVLLAPTHWQLALVLAVPLVLQLRELQLPWVLV